MPTKTCSRCKTVKSVDQFYPRKQRIKCPFASYCIQCSRKDKNARYKKDKKHYQTIRKNWRNKNKDKVKIQNRKQYLKNREYRILSAKEYAAKNKDKVRIYNNKYQRERKKYDIWFKFKKILGRRMHHVLKDESRKSITDKYIGCTGEQFRKHIESQFTKGMSWESYGHFGWHIDHIKPLKAFDLTQEEERIKAFNYKNLQPLWWLENLKKGKKYDYEIKNK